MCEMQQCPSITTTSIFELDYEKKSIFTHLYLQVLEEELKQKKMKVIIAFTTSCLVNIQSFCLYNKLQTDSDWLGSHNIIIEKMDLINSIVGINQ